MKDDNFRGNDQSRQAASKDDNVRNAVTWQDTTTYSMALPEVYARFADAGFGRTLRTLQRYCEQGHFRAVKYPADTGSVWYVDPESVETKIEEIRQVQETLGRQAPPLNSTPEKTNNDVSRHDADCRDVSPVENKDDSGDISSATSDDEPRQENSVAGRRASNDNINQRDKRESQTTTIDEEKYVTVPVVVLDALTAQLDAKDEQIKRRDAQIEQLVEAHNNDRQLLGAALAIIHKEDFPLELRESQQHNPQAEPEPAEEIRPESARGGDKPQPPHSGTSV